MRKTRLRFDPISFALGKEAGGGGTTDYDALSNRPSIGGVTLTGDKTAADLGLAAAQDLSGKLDASRVGTANGVAELDGAGKVLASQLPSYVDDVLEYAAVANFPAAGESGKIYVATSTNLTYRWTGTGYADISQSIALGETSSTAYRGDRGKIAYDHSQTTGNAHNMTKANIGLGNVDNTSDANKPVSTAQQAALDGKVDKVTGKGLSTNDYTTEEKNKLSGVEAQANKTTIDATLSNTGQAADAKATGDAVAALRNYIASMEVYRTASGNPATFDDGAAANLKNVSVTITPTQSGSGDPSPSNVRPISGVSSVTVTRTGKNLLELKAESQTVSGVSFTVDRTNGTVTANGTAASTVYFKIDDFDFKAGTQYVLSGCPSGGSGTDYYVYNGKWSDNVRDMGSGSRIFDGSETTKPTQTSTDGSVVYVVITSGATANNLVFRPMVRVASGTDATFEPCQGQSVTVSLVDSNSNPLTVYGGTLDVTTGTLTVTHKSFTVSGDMHRYSSNDTSTHYTFYTPALDTCEAYSTNKALSDKAVLTHTPPASVVVCVYIANGGGRCVFYFRKDLLAEATNAAANAWLAENPVQIVAPLATPVTYQLTPQQLAALAGYNAVSADAGTLDVIYKADTSITFGGA